MGRKTLMSLICFIVHFGVNAQFKNLDVGYGFGSSAQQVTEFQITSYPIKVELEGFVEQTGYMRLSHIFMNFELLHTASISEISFINSVSPDSVSGDYQDRNTYSNLAYDLILRPFPNAPVQFIGGLKANFYLKSKKNQGRAQQITFLMK
jgi:hypothetical protein